MTECFVIWSNVMHPSHETGMYMKPAGISRNEQFSKFKQHSGTYGVVRHIKDFSGMPFEYRKFTLNRLQMILAHSKRISSWTQLKCNWNPVGIFRMLSQCPCIDVSVELLRRTWWTVVHSQQKSLAVNICVLPLSGSWSYRAIDGRVSVVGAFLWRARRLGIRCQTVFVTLKTYIFAKYWWQSVLSALEIFLSMRYRNLHFTYFTRFTYSGGMEGWVNLNRHDSQR